MPFRWTAWSNWPATRLYLSRGHAQHADMGCPIPALAAEVGRAGPEVRETFERALEQRQRRLAELMGDENRAWVLTCLSVGAVLLARAQASEVARDKVLDAALEHALGLLSASGAVSPQADRD
nr:hypothetical protein [Pseudomonas aeruginosa]